MLAMVGSSVFMGILWDMSTAWLHKQWADTAANAACAAGTMDMVWATNNVPVGSTPVTPVAGMNFLPAAGATNSGDCATNSSNPVCYYAKLNGYDSVTNNDVQWATSITPPSSLGSGSTTMTQSSNGVPAFLNVTITDNMPAYFFGAFSTLLGMSKSWKSVPVGGHCSCGMMGTYQAGTPTNLTMSLTDTDDLDCIAGPYGGSFYGDEDGQMGIDSYCSWNRVGLTENQAIPASATTNVTVQFQTTGHWPAGNTSNGFDYVYQCGSVGSTSFIYQYWSYTSGTYNQTQTFTITCPPGSISNLNQVYIMPEAGLDIPYPGTITAEVNTIMTVQSAQIIGATSPPTWTNITATTFSAD
jgi:hypothetical protein